MKKLIAGTAIVAAGLVGTAGVASANNGNGPNPDAGVACANLGQIHSGLAKAGNIGKPGVAAHNPGAHRGMAGFCS